MVEKKKILSSKNTTVYLTADIHSENKQPLPVLVFRCLPACKLVEPRLVWSVDGSDWVQRGTQTSEHNAAPYGCHIRLKLWYSDAPRVRDWRPWGYTEECLEPRWKNKEILLKAIILICFWTTTLHFSLFNVQSGIEAKSGSWLMTFGRFVRLHWFSVLKHRKGALEKRS